MRRLLAIAVLALAGCVSVSEDVNSLSGIGGDAVLVVGKIEIVPPVRADEQKYRAGWDPFDTKRHFVGRAVMFMAARPESAERTGLALNPPLEQTYFLKVPRSERFMVKGSVVMEHSVRAVSRRQSVVDQSELLFPAPIEFDIRPGDAAVYVGTLRLHRDEFHEVTQAEVRDDYAQAMADFRTRFPGAPLPRKALLRRATVAAAAR
ncbi:MAG: hypothetical protein KJ025_04400 [Burkholderiales bacterium]|nr:hypothetical protein [Burkholderiales bacterium]